MIFWQLKEKEMTSNELHRRVAERRKRTFKKSLFINLALLLPPILLTIVIVLTALSTYILSLCLLYFILPMFYTVEKRLRYDIAGIGKPGFSYADAYKAFFTQNMGGVFGALGAVLWTLLLFFFIITILENAFPAIANCFPEAGGVVEHISELFVSQNADMNTLMDYVVENGHLLTRPLTILFGVSAFIPLFLAIFYFFDNNLSMHYLSTIVLPDIDKNISASQARSLSKLQFGRLIQGHRLKESFRNNWPYYLAFSVLYGVILYACSFISTNNIMVLPLIILLAPSLSLFYGLLLNYFCLLNDYCVLEESQELLLSRMPAQTRLSVYQTYCSPNYVHGEESAARGCFVPAPTYREEHPFSSPFDAQNTGGETAPSYENTSDTPRSDSEPSQKPADPTGIVIDLSGTKDDEDKEKNEQ